MSGRLSIVATPIGNLEDITLRALRVLREADTILAEDTRHTRKLCAHHDITGPLRAFHAHSSERAVEQCVAELAGGAHFALVSDAGTPLISDPGANLVRAARSAGIQVEAIPGPSAVATGLCVSGIPFDSYRFVGFLPRSGGRRKESLSRIAKAREASVFFEAPRRLVQTLADLSQATGESRQVAVCRELTKLHEEVVQGSLAEVIARLSEGEVRGEITVVVQGEAAEAAAARDKPTEADLDDTIRQALAAGRSPRDVARDLSTLHGLKRREVYTRVLSIAEADDA